MYPKAKVSDNVKEELDRAVRIMEDACRDARQEFESERHLIGATTPEVDAILGVLHRLTWAHANATSHIHNAIKRYEFSVDQKIFTMSEILKKKQK